MYLKILCIQKKKKNGEDERGSEMDLKLCELTGYLLPTGRENATVSPLQATEDAQTKLGTSAPASVITPSS